MSKSFTLIELLVVAAIILILAVIVFPYYNQGSRSFALQRTANKLAQDIRRAKEMAMSMQECKICSPGNEFPKAYGIFLTPGNDFYILYAEIDGNDFYTSSQDTIVEEIRLEKGVKIEKIYVAPNDNRPNGCITFTPPDPSVEIKYDVTNKGGEIKATLYLENEPSKKKVVKANRAGMISVE